MSLTYGLFETMADVCDTIIQLREQGYANSSFSLLARDLEADSGDQDDRRPTIAQVVRALEVSPVAEALTPTALVIIPEAGTYLTAGWPVHALVNSGRNDRPEYITLDLLFQEMGCPEDEAAFVDGRLQSGAILLGVSNDSPDALVHVREMFADHQAVHVGLVEDPTTVAAPWPVIELPDPNSPAAGKALIIDISATVQGDHDAIGTEVRDEDGADVGTIAYAIFAAGDDAEHIVRYLVIEHGGFLGVGRQLHVIPISLIRTADDSGHQIMASLDVIENGPAYDARLPLSRREELTICGYYGTTPYWDT